MSFGELGLTESLLRGVFSYGWEHPSQLQTQTVPALVGGRDVLVQAPSGTGKTGCFGLGLLQRCVAQPTNALVVSPSRELARQTHGVLTELARFEPRLTPVLTTGGRQRRQQDIDELRSHELFVMVGTPGRVLDIVQSQPALASTVGCIVLDEADELLSIDGFQDTVRTIFGLLPKDAVLGLFSATLPSAVLELASSLQQDPLRIIVEDRTRLTLRGITQYFCACEANVEKLRMVEHMYQHWDVAAAVIFCSSRDRVDWLADQLCSRGFPVGRLHSNMTNPERVEAMARFRAGHTRIIVATQLIARGIDVQNVQLVLQFDLVRDQDIYLHAIGRCGRYGRKGVSVCFVASDEHAVLHQLCTAYGIEARQLPASMDIPEIDQLQSGVCN